MISLAGQFLQTNHFRQFHNYVALKLFDFSLLNTVVPIRSVLQCINLLSQSKGKRSLDYVHVGANLWVKLVPDDGAYLCCK